jgi:hypothetical protein
LATGRRFGDEVVNIAMDAIPSDLRPFLGVRYRRMSQISTDGTGLDRSMPATSHRTGRSRTHDLGVGGFALAALQVASHFNLGVELCHIAAGALARPGLLWLPRSQLYRALSGVAALVGAVWFVQRALAM